CHLRQQRGKPAGQSQDCLADYVAPVETGLADYIGAFAVTAGIGIDEHVHRFEREHDDYSAILVKALADRLAEACTEYLHECVRREHWGYAPDEKLTNAELIDERYRGIRPAPGYPACPDHTEKAKLWRLLDAETAIGLKLTESYAMVPTAAVSGFYFSHPEAKYFSVGQVGRDQVGSLAARRGVPVAEAERWLPANPGHDPATAAPARHRPPDTLRRGTGGAGASTSTPMPPLRLARYMSSSAIFRASGRRGGPSSKAMAPMLTPVSGRPTRRMSRRSSRCSFAKYAPAPS